MEKRNKFLNNIEVWSQQFSASIEKYRSRHIVFIYWSLAILLIKSSTNLGSSLGPNKLYFLFAVPIIFLFKPASKSFFTLTIFFLLVSAIIYLIDPTLTWNNNAAVMAMNSLLIALVLVFFEIRFSKSTKI